MFALNPTFFHSLPLGKGGTAINHSLIRLLSVHSQSDVLFIKKR
jgi:hypothetical protein